MTPIEQVRDEGNCGEATNRGEEACECAGKLTMNRRQPHSRQICEVTDRNLIQGRCGQASEGHQRWWPLPDLGHDLSASIRGMIWPPHWGEPFWLVIFTPNVASDSNNATIRCNCQLEIYAIQAE